MRGKQNTYMEKIKTDLDSRSNCQIIEIQGTEEHVVRWHHRDVFSRIQNVGKSTGQTNLFDK